MHCEFREICHKNSIQFESWIRMIQDFIILLLFWFVLHEQCCSWICDRFFDLWLLCAIRWCYLITMCCEQRSEQMKRSRMYRSTGQPTVANCVAFRWHYFVVGSAAAAAAVLPMNDLSIKTTWFKCLRIFVQLFSVGTPSILSMFARIFEHLSILNL